MSEKYQSTLETILSALVEYPQDIKIDKKIDDMGVLLSIHVNSLDAGRVIGRGGNTAKAIRTLMRVIGMREDARVSIKILDPKTDITDDPTSNPLA